MRREFSAKTKLTAFERSKGKCEDCGARLFPGNLEYDHQVPDALGGEPTIDNCVCRCRACHGAKTHKDRKTIAKSNHVRKKHLGLKAGRGFRGWRKFDGTIVWNK